MIASFLKNLIPKIQSNHNFFFCGRKGTGKTWLAIFFFQFMPRGIIIDVKNEYHDQDQGIIVTGFTQFAETFVKLQNYDKYKLIFKFDPNSQVDRVDVFDSICKLAYDFGHVALLIDEIQFFCTPHKLPKYLMEIATAGRYADISLFMTTTRPSFINKTLTSCIDYFFLGNLLNQSDRDFFSDILGESRKSLATLLNRQFIVYDVNSNEKKLIET